MYVSKEFASCDAAVPGIGGFKPVSWSGIRYMMTEVHTHTQYLLYIQCACIKCLFICLSITHCAIASTNRIKNYIRVATFKINNTCLVNSTKDIIMCNNYYMVVLLFCHLLILFRCFMVQ